MMKKRHIMIFVVMIGLFIVSFSALAAGGWSKIKESNGIKLYERPVAGTDLMEYMAVTTIDARMEVIGEALRDVPKYPEWVADCSSAIIEKKYDRNTFVMYLILNPFMIEDRDIVLKDETVYDYDHGNAKINFFCTDEIKMPPVRGRTRVTVMNGLFQMEFLAREKTKFIYKLKTDPAGNIPKKVAYAVMKYYPYNTLKKLKAFVAKNEKKYADLAKGSEEEIQINERSRNESSARKILTETLIRAVKDKKAMEAIIAADTEGIRKIALSGGDYETIRQVAKNACFKYIDLIIKDQNLAQKLKKDEKLVARITDLVQTETEAESETIDSIVAPYLQ
ncbi:MAG TPA: hypothetical protein PLT45_08580 [Smithella sp.]|nr:hypothetical protein [Smithella sp.]